MSQTFEEALSGRLPGLYAAARFIAADRAAVAEGLLADALSTAFSRFDTWQWDATGWERALVDEALGRWTLGLPPAGRGEPEVRPERPHSTPLATAVAALDRFDSSTFYQAAGHMPTRARIAIWLVVLEDWGYDAAADALGVDREELMDLLAWRETHMAHSVATAPIPWPSRDRA